MLRRRERDRFAHPSLDLMETWLVHRQYHCFRKACQAGGRKCMERHAGDLMYFACCYGNDDYHYDLSVTPWIVKPTPERLRFLLEELRLPVNCYFRKHGSLLLYAVASLNPDLVELCLRAGADPNATKITRGSVGNGAATVKPALHHLIATCFKDNPSLSVYRCPKHIDDNENSGDDDRRTKVSAVAQLLCDNGANVHTRAQGEESSPLLLLLSYCQHCRSSNFTRSVGLKSQPLIDGSMQAYGDYVCPHDRCSSEVLDILLQHGAELPDYYTSPNTATSCQVSLLSLLMRGFPSVVWTILKRGGKLMMTNVTDKERCLLLRYAVACCCVDLVKYLLRACADTQSTPCESTNESGNELISADKPAKSSPTIVAKLVGKGKTFTGDRSTYEIERVLWSVATQRSDLLIFEALHDAGVAVTQADLLQSALSTDSRLVHFMLDKLPLSVDIAANALRLQSAYCLLQLAYSRESAILSAGNLERLVAKSSPIGDFAVSALMPESATSHDVSTAGTSGIKHGGKVCYESDNTVTSDQVLGSDHPLVKVLMTAVESFHRALEHAGQGQEQPSPQGSVIDIAGHGIREARTWDDFQRIAAIEILREATGATLNGLVIHALLVLGRVLPKEKFCFNAFQKVVALLLPSASSQPFWHYGMTQSFEESQFPFSCGRACSSEELTLMLGSYTLLLHHIALWKDIAVDELKDLLRMAMIQSRAHNHLSALHRSFPAMTIDKQASSLAQWIISNRLVIDTRPVFHWLCQMISVMETPVERSCVLSNAVRLLLTIAGCCHQSSEMRRQIDDVVGDLVHLSKSSPSDYNILYLALREVLDELNKTTVKNTTNGGDLTKYFSLRRGASLLVVKAVLASGGSQLVNQVGPQDLTAAHLLINWRFQVSDDHQLNLVIELLQLLDVHGQHWDYCYKQATSLQELLERIPSLSSFRMMLSCRPTALQCQAASSAAHLSRDVLDHFLPKQMVEFVLKHRPRAAQPLCFFK